MINKLLVEIEWVDGSSVDAEWFHKIVYDGLSDNGFDEAFKHKGKLIGDYKLLRVTEVESD
jgi:hypothetical protein